MTRFLASALGAAEPGFSQSIAALERAAGQPSADIRMTEQIARRTREKIAELGLDSNDTTGEELYAALQQKLKNDEAQVCTALNIADDDPASTVIAKVQRFLSSREPKPQCFALKPSAAKRLLKKKPPKLAMKRLGYRSIDSMLKHEPVAQLYAAASIVESGSWRRAYLDQYTKLSPSDFEQRNVQILAPSSKRWQGLSAMFVNRSHHNMMSFKELGAIVLLPMDDRLEGLTITELLLTLEEINALRAHSSFAKLQQVKPDFGHIIRDELAGQSYMTAQLAGQPVSWHVIQRYYHEHPDAYHPEIFEPHVQPDDLTWQHSEDVLADLNPSLRFWQETQSLGLIHNDKPVSMNVRDAAVNFCNGLPFSARITHFLRDNIWHDLMLRYLDQESLETALREQLMDSLAEPNTLQETADA